jgi:hypothetical protein
MCFIVVDENYKFYHMHMNVQYVLLHSYRGYKLRVIILLI